MSGRRVWKLGLEILDRQLEDRNGHVCGKVDDLELTMPSDPDAHGAPFVTAILCGPGAVGHRLPPPFGRWLRAAWRRWRNEEDPDPVRIAWAAVSRIDYEIHLTVDAQQAGLTSSEDWVRRHLIGRIPGARR